ncbi:cupin domain-containing protein [candidate division KSB1 bacterium]|nr:cupin domain-containing protein [candidate division KSB1 bacterium]
MEIVNRGKVGVFKTKDTAEIREILAPRNSAIKNQSLAEATLIPGQCTVEHLHLGTEEIYYILKGRGRIFIDGEEALVGKGDGIAIPSRKKHLIANIGKGNLVFLCCCSPAYTHEDTVLI